MPRTGQAEKAFVATRGLICRLHAQRMAVVSVAGERFTRYADRVDRKGV
jgi:hypothetical protein